MKILYFASLREKLGLDSEEVDVPLNYSVSDLISLLSDQHGTDVFADNIICAVNQSVAKPNTLLSETDEIAFYPPVTGG